MRPLGRRPRLGYASARHGTRSPLDESRRQRAPASCEVEPELRHPHARDEAHRPAPVSSREVPRGPAPPRRALGPHLRRRPQARLPARDSELPDRRLDLEIARMSQGGVRRRPQENTCDIRLLALRESAPAARSGVSPANPPIAQECDSNPCVVRHSDCLREVAFFEAIPCGGDTAGDPDTWRPGPARPRRRGAATADCYLQVLGGGEAPGVAVVKRPGFPGALSTVPTAVWRQRGFVLATVMIAPP